MDNDYGTMTRNSSGPAQAKTCQRPRRNRECVVRSLSASIPQTSPARMGAINCLWVKLVPEVYFVCEVKKARDGSPHHLNRADMSHMPNLLRRRRGRARLTAWVVGAAMLGAAACSKLAPPADGPAPTSLAKADP